MHEIVHDRYYQTDQKKKEKRLSDPCRSTCHTSEAENSSYDSQK